MILSGGDIAEVAVNAPLDRLFHYAIPRELRNTLQRGHRVLVPFGRRSTTGVCIGFPVESQVRGLKPIQEILQPECRFNEHLLELTRWLSEYYFASWGEVLEAALPPGIRTRKPARKPTLHLRANRDPQALLEEATRLERRARAQSRLLRALAESPGPHRPAALVRDLPTSRDAIRKLEERGFLVHATVESQARPGNGEATPAQRRDWLTALSRSRLPDDAIRLHEDQVAALDIIDTALQKASPTAFDATQGGATDAAPVPVLIHGVTGSGKTEVYLRALHRVLKRGGRGLVLVPEISLTPQTVDMFRRGLPGVPLAVLHSLLSSRQRAKQWREIQSGRVGVVIGARSAIFSPVPELSIIIVDEEHDSSYKQESSPRYNGRDVAIMRAHMLRIPIVLGSATPSMESYTHALGGKYTLVNMPRRVTPHDLPSISVTPLDGDYYRADGSGLLCGPLDFQIKQCLKRGEQAILFLNRRGFATFLHCTRCGFVLKCDSCDIALTYHRGAGETRCHYCDARYMNPGACPECQFPALRRCGTGTEKAAEVIARLYEGVRVARMDRDTIKNQDALREVLEKFSGGEADILVGTQMLAKGHDFPGVSLVGILSADTGLHFPDFRAAERTFQIITQVSGRAGRGHRSGKVIVQTFFPDHYAIRHAVKNEYRAFYEAETEHRRALGYPPFSRLAKILVRATREDRTLATAEAAAGRLREAGAAGTGVEVLGPAAAPITRIQDHHRYQILVKAPTATILHRVLRSAKLHPGGRMTAEVIVDIDPQSML